MGDFQPPHKKQLMTVRKSLFIILFSTLFSFNVLAQNERIDVAPINDAYYSESGVHFSLVQSDVALPGSDVHLWLKANLPGVHDSIPVKFSITMNSMPVDEAWLNFSQMASEWALNYQIEAPKQNSKEGNTVQSSGTPNTVEITLGPPTPTTPGSMIGDTATMHLQCEQIDASGTYADVEYDYKWQYTEDTDGDGENDSDPDWVLVVVKITMLSHQAQSNCSQ